jgi:hypothetical protein
MKLLGTITAILASVSIAAAGSPHFVGSLTQVVVGDTLTVSGKEAGLGNETQVHIELTATALCINPGGKHPKAVNKEDVTAAGDFPVQNGQATFSLSVSAVFQPDCTPPMTVAFTDVVVCDTEHDVCK